jgi:anti-sigma factor RsiW
MKIPEGDKHCSKLLEQFSAYLEDDLKGDCCKQLEAHLAACPECFESLEQFRQLLGRCSEARSSDSQTVSGSLRKRILEKIRNLD